MKKIILLFLIFTSLLFLCCSKATNSVRFTNNYKETINNVQAGSAFFGSVDPGKTTDYKYVTSRSFVVSGTSNSFQQLQGTESVAKKGTHKYTITLNSAGTLDFKED